MPAYNCKAYIRESVESILTQTFRNFEFIIIDDASDDGTYEYLQTLADSRIRLIRKPVRSGYCISLNMGLDLFRGEYLARMDADDISEKTRLEKQLNFLETHNEILCCGSNYIEMPSGKKVVMAESADEIAVGLLTNNQMAHPSVMIRSSVFRENGIRYDVQAEPSEDYLLWTQIVGLGKLHNLQEYLLRYRVHESQASQSRAEIQKNKAKQIARSYALQLIGIQEGLDIFLNDQIRSLSAHEVYLKLQNKIATKLESQGYKDCLYYLQRLKAKKVLNNFAATGIFKRKYIAILLSAGFYGILDRHLKHQLNKLN